MSQTVQIKHISGDLSALNALQIGVQSMADSDLGYKTWGGKDAAGTLTQWLGKDLPARVKSFAIKDMIESGASTCVLQVSADGVVSKGPASSGIGKTLVSSFDITPGTLSEKLVDSDYISFLKIERDGNEQLQPQLMNVFHFLKGNTQYGGSIVTDFNSIFHSGVYTGYGTAIGAPSTEYSWFVFHQNSNAGIAAAMQIAFAYRSDHIICFERVKTSNIWGTWHLRSSSGTTISSIVYQDSIMVGGCLDHVSLYAGSETQWSVMAQCINPQADMSLVQGSSWLRFYCHQPIVGKHYILALYKYASDGNHTLICACPLAEMPADSSWQQMPISKKIADIVGGDCVYGAIFTDANGATILGNSNASLSNTLPYITGYAANLGVLTEAPSTLSFDGEEDKRFYFGIHV